jgi:L-amino acid N-acyltransferase YncA
MDRYPREKTLKNGSCFTIREPSKEDELMLLNFFKSLPVGDRQYLRMDVTQLENLRRRMTPTPEVKIWRLVAEHDGKIWADATLSAPATGWSRHTCELRCIVHPDFQKKGLGSVLMWELFQKTLSEGYRILICEVVPEQSIAVKVLKDLGFRQVMNRKNHVKDLAGQKHDLQIYTMDVKAMWDRLKMHFDGFDTEFGHV